jgi:enamine deaminase RidA (YjgF/YER057c/UK114 family)
MRRYHLRPDGLPVPNGFSQAVEFDGKLVAVSGQVAYDADGKVVCPGDAEGQTRQVFANLRIALAAAGAGLEHVVKFTFYLTDRADLEAVRRVRNEVIDPSAAPASTLVIVSGLVDPALRVEIDALAAV